MSLRGRRQNLSLSCDQYASRVPGRSRFNKTIKGQARLDYFAFPAVLRDSPTITSEWHSIAATVAGASVVGEGRVGGELYKKQQLLAGSQCVVMPALHDVFWEWSPLHSADKHKERCTFGLQLSPQLLQKTAEEVLQKDASRFELLSNPTFNDPMIYTLLQAMYTQCVEEGPFNSIYMDSALNMLCVHLLSNRNLTSYNSKQTLSGFEQWVSGKSGKGLNRRTLFKVHSYIMENLNRPVSLKDMATISGLSEYHFMRLFKSATGISPYQYVIHCRIGRAKQLLCKTVLPITDIALNVATFPRHFVKQSAAVLLHTGRVYGVTEQ